jgi:hypothetical protein
VGKFTKFPLVFESRQVLCLYCYKQKITGESGEGGGGGNILQANKMDIK